MCWAHHSQPIASILGDWIAPSLKPPTSSQAKAPFDTVKGVFVEGEQAYPGSGFSDKTHIQIAVRNPKMIKGVFRVDQELLA